MTSLPVGLPIALALLVPSLGSAQTLPSFQDLALRVNLDDRIRIEEPSGATATGRLTRLTRDELTVQTDAGERRFTSAAVRTITVRRSSRSKGVLIGAGVGAAAGALLACTGQDHEECPDGAILLGALGASVGLAVSALVPRTTTVYRASTDLVTSPGSAQPPGPFDDLALRVNLDDRIRVRNLSGATTTGRLTRLTGDEMIVATNAGEKRFTSAGVREVAVRRHPLGKSALIAAGAFGLLAVAVPSCRSNPDCQPIAAAGIGAGVGLAVGALIPGMTTVLQLPQKHARLSSSWSPALSRGAVGVRATLRW